MMFALHGGNSLQALAAALITYAVSALVLGAVIWALVALVLRVWKPLDAAARYAVWYVALVAVIVGPLATTLAIHPARVVIVQDTSAKLVALAVPRELIRTPVPQLRPAIAVPPIVAYGAAGTWLLVALVGIARFVAGAVVLARLKRDALPLSPERRAALPLWRSRADAGSRATRLCVSDRVEVPVAVGLFDGMIVIPQHVIDEFDAADVDRFVLHEFAHLERRDDWTTVVQRFVQIVMFFNPAVHVIARQLDLEREIACDDRVIAATSDVRSYAVGLTRMAESTAWPHRGIATPAIFVTRKQLSLRVERLLTGRRFSAQRFAFAPAAIALAVSLGVVAVAAPLAPSFEIGAARPHGPAELTRIEKTLIEVVDHNGKHTTKEAHVLVYGGDPQKLSSELRALGLGDPKELAAALKKLGVKNAGGLPDRDVTYTVQLHPR